MHKPVLLNEVLELLDPQPGEFFIDGTVNAGGHAKVILEKIGSKGKLLGVDLDPKVLSAQNSPLSAHKNVTLVSANYVELSVILKKQKLGKADGLLLDLGFSSEQIEDSGRGFSFSEARSDEPLLMTYSDDATPVREIIRELSEKELANIIFEFGGERRSRQIAKAIKDHGRHAKIETAGELVAIVREALPKNYEHGRINPATRTFQALRIYANGELENVRKVVSELPEILVPGGRAAIITFHSLEDRIVKLAFRDLVKNKVAEYVNKKPIGPSREEIRENVRSRSAKVRAIKMSGERIEKSG